ncbi:hypothetical protein BU16DRAFT_22929 [Lophium mytilinum]|uniref:Uncharacterized protein n=1 Tax=Lophium mytilinum TaxID=390894 RepID=A0A6A6REU8_9PEZI|nr:hypothetical protein BU16DRAFT_22929 [Lophium mytilinum]
MRPGCPATLQAPRFPALLPFPSALEWASFRLPSSIRNPDAWLHCHRNIFCQLPLLCAIYSFWTITAQRARSEAPLSPLILQRFGFLSSGRHFKGHSRTLNGSNYGAAEWCHGPQRAASRR